MIKRDHWVNLDNLENFILHCQWDEGGIGDRPGNEVDVFHTFFGIASLSLIDKEKYNLKRINEIYALPEYIVKQMKHLEL